MEIVIPPTYRFKYKQEALQMTMLNPILLILLAEMNLWAHIQALPWVYTRTLDKKIPGISTSNIHADGRAADLSINGWEEPKILEFCDHFNGKYAKKYGTSAVGGEPRVAFYEKVGGTAPHFHIQIRKGISPDVFYTEFYSKGVSK